MTFKKLSEYFKLLEQNTSRLKITEILAELFKECSSEEIDKVCYLSLGRLLPAYEGLEFQMAGRLMERAISRAVGMEVKKVVGEYKKVGDLGAAAQELKVQSSIPKGFPEGGKFKVQSLFGNTREGKDLGGLGVLKVYERLLEIAREGGAGSVEWKVDKMAALLEDLDALSVRFVVRIPLGKLRMGFSEMTVLDGLSWMVKGDKSLRHELEDAYNVVADIGEIAKCTKSSGNVKGIKPKIGTPIVSALAQRLGTVEEMLEKAGSEKEGVALEPKYDGERLQLHKDDGVIKMFTRNLENATNMFPEIAEALRKEVKAREVILDGEGVGFNPKTGKFIPFQETIKRKRKHGIGEAAKEIPFKCFVFDIMYKDGESLIKNPFIKRRKILEKVLSLGNKTLILTPQIVTKDPKEMRKFHEEQIKIGLEGAMVKKLHAPYDPGRRGFTWVKFKQEETKKGGGLADTIDAVIMGVTRGEGKRASFGVGACLVGIRKGEHFVTVTNIGTGLTDEQFRELKKRSDKLKIKEKPESYQVEKNHIPDFWIKPGIVVEIQADNITKSPTHTAGLALRFPRLIRFRDDKSYEQITTVKEVERLYSLQFGAS